MNKTNTVDTKFLMAIVEQLKLPLINIARQAEYASQTPNFNYQDISNIADMAIRLIDSYLLSIGEDQEAMLLEPLSLSSVMSSTADNLTNIAHMYNCEVKLKLGGISNPVISERNRLEAAFTMLGYSFIEAYMSHQSKTKAGEVVLTTFRTRNGTTAGIFSPQLNVSKDIFKRALLRVGNARQTMPDISQSAGAGIFIANSILSSLSTKLRVTRYNNATGLCVTLLPSKQLQLI